MGPPNVLLGLNCIWTMTYLSAHGLVVWLLVVMVSHCLGNASICHISQAILMVERVDLLEPCTDCMRSYHHHCCPACIMCCH